MLAPRLGKTLSGGLKSAHDAGNSIGRQFVGHKGRIGEKRLDA